MLTGVLLGVIVILRCFPQTATARWLDQQVGEARVRLATLERRHLVFLVLMTVILFAGAELLAMAGPLDMGLVVMWDISTYVDIVLTGVTVAAAARGRAGWRPIAVRLARVRPRHRARRSLAARRPEKTAANDEDRPRALAA